MDRGGLISTVTDRDSSISTVTRPRPRRFDLDCYWTATVRSRPSLDRYWTATVRSRPSLDRYWTVTVRSRPLLNRYWTATVRSRPLPDHCGSISTVTGPL
eukprot:680007-Prorocentrum_minimum.AAC.1